MVKINLKFTKRCDQGKDEVSLTWMGTDLVGTKAKSSRRGVQEHGKRKAEEYETAASAGLKARCEHSK